MNDVFICLNKPLIDTLKGVKNYEKLNFYLRILLTGLKKDFVDR